MHSYLYIELYLMLYIIYFTWHFYRKIQTVMIDFVSKNNNKVIIKTKERRKKLNVCTQDIFIQIGLTHFFLIVHWLEYKITVE
jgi:hypothetical protein